MSDLVGLVDSFDRLVANAAGLVPTEVNEAAAKVGRRIRTRHGHLGETVVVALAGGTGSGKSSLLNAIAGEDVADVGARRPTTDAPLAWIPEDAEAELAGLVDQLAIDRRVHHRGPRWLAVIDLPDTDSVVTDHRHTVSRLLPEVDAVLWVLDPEKYQDRSLHQRYLEALTSHADRFVFVINQIDRVAEADRAALVSDLIRTLEADGIERPRVLVTAADPPLGPPEGIEELTETLAELGDAKRLVLTKAITDLRESAAQIAVEAGIEGGSGTGFDARWTQARWTTARMLSDGLLAPPLRSRAADQARRAATSQVKMLGRDSDGWPPRIVLPDPQPEGATEVLMGLLSDLSQQVGEATSRRLAESIDALGSEIEEATRQVSDGFELVPGPKPLWWRWARVIRWAALAGAASVIGWLAVDSSVEPSLPLVLLAALGATSIAVPLIVGRSGIGLMSVALDASRPTLEEALARSLDNRIGRSLREILRERASLAAAHADLELLIAKVEAERGHPNPPSDHAH